MANGVVMPIAVNEWRVQVLSPWLVRIEQKGPGGFEDRATFTVVDRTPQAADAGVSEQDGCTRIYTDDWEIRIPETASALDAIALETKAGGRRMLGSHDLKNTWLPSPSELPASWILSDHPRIVPPAQGALPPPGNEKHPKSGWDMTHGATDLYLFFPQASGYERFREDFLRLTGPVPVPPLYAFGLWYSRYHPYGENTALDVIDRFRRASIPLDVFVVDTDWRVGASCGYAVNTNLFPDMARFVQRAHDKQVRIMLNDHPEPRGTHALSPEELTFRHDGLRALLDMGVDVWWYDRNWHTHLQEPAPGLCREVWGMRLYHDVTREARPNQRPLIMSNADGINNGRMETPSHPAAHRYPVWWTGDTIAEWEYLARGVSNGVDAGVVSLLPYVHEDLTGHHGQPDPELYVRFMQYGVLSPIARIHCTVGVTRYPWNYGPNIERITGNYIRLRYRLLPMIYAAAHRAAADGTPLLRRCDLEWPLRPEARDSTQYLFGDDLLVAPILAPAEEYQPSRRTVWIPDGEWVDAWDGKTIRGPLTVTVESKLHQTPLFVRLGGVIFSAPQTFHTTDARWEELVADAYVPTGDGKTARRLVEDDGLSAGETALPPSVTTAVFERKGNTVSLSVSAAGPKESRTASRAWTFRFHVPAGGRAESVLCNGKPLSGEQYAVLSPAKEPPRELFTGPGAQPAPAEGDVVEVRQTIDASNPIRLELIVR